MERRFITNLPFLCFRIGVIPLFNFLGNTGILLTSSEVQTYLVLMHIAKKWMNILKTLLQY